MKKEENNCKVKKENRSNTVNDAKKKMIQR